MIRILINDDIFLALKPYTKDAAPRQDGNFHIKTREACSSGNTSNIGYVHLYNHFHIEFSYRILSSDFIFDCQYIHVGSGYVKQ